MRKSYLHLVLLMSPLLLAGCGDGWEPQRTTEILPYGNQRTAGSGVVYVRAKMMPEKEIVIEEQKPQGYEEIKSGEEIFTKAQTKGASPVSDVKTETKAEPEKKSDDLVDDKKDQKSQIQDSEDKAEVAPAAGNDEALEAPQEKAAARAPAPPKTYEQILDEQNNAKKAVSPEKVEPHAGYVMPEKQSALVAAPGSSSIDIVDIPEEIKMSSSESGKGVVNVQELRSPMMTVYNRDMEAEKSLEEIYSNPF